MVDAAGQAGEGRIVNCSRLVSVAKRNGMGRVACGPKSRNTVGESGLLNTSLHGVSGGTPASPSAGVEETNWKVELSAPTPVVNEEMVGCASLSKSSRKPSTSIRYCWPGFKTNVSATLEDDWEARVSASLSFSYRRMSGVSMARRTTQTSSRSLGRS